MTNIFIFDALLFLKKSSISLLFFNFLSSVGIFLVLKFSVKQNAFSKKSNMPHQPNVRWFERLIRLDLSLALAKYTAEPLGFGGSAFSSAVSGGSRVASATSFPPFPLPVPLLLIRLPLSPLPPDPGGGIDPYGKGHLEAGGRMACAHPRGPLGPSLLRVPPQGPSSSSSGAQRLSWGRGYPPPKESASSSSEPAGSYFWSAQDPVG